MVIDHWRSLFSDRVMRVLTSLVIFLLVPLGSMRLVAVTMVGRVPVMVHVALVYVSTGRLPGVLFMVMILSSLYLCVVVMWVSAAVPSTFCVSTLSRRLVGPERAILVMEVTVVLLVV